MSQEYGIYLERFQGDRDRRQDNLQPVDGVFLAHPEPENTERLQLVRRGVLDLYLRPEGVTSTEGFTDEYHYRVVHLVG